MNVIYWLLCVLIGLTPAVLVYRSDRKKNIPVKWLPAILRFVTCFLTAALLLAPAFPSTKTEEEKPVLLWLQDNSSSMNKALGKDSAAYRAKVKALWDQWKDDYTLVPLAFGGDLNKDSLFRYGQKSTNIAAALQSATEQYQDRNIGAVILPTDGIFNEGLDPLYAPLGNAVPVFTIGLGDSTQPKDVSVTRVYANKLVALNSNFEIIADIRADKLNGTATEVSVLHNGQAIGRSPIRVDKDRYSTSVRFETKADQKGFQKYSILVPPADGEQNTANNRLDFFVEVIDEETKVLILAAAPHPDIAAIREALESVPQYKVTVTTDGSIPGGLAAYSLVIAHQVPASGGMQPDLGNT
ncbi:MAG: VWA domain-containing protein, partial [Sphingobacteriales bacterium]